MKEAIAVDVNGNYIGPYKEFTNEQWDSMERSFGKRMRWKLLQDIKEEPEISIEESEKIFGEGEPNEEPNEEPIFEYDLDINLTKRELIEKYNLSEELMKSTKAQIIDKISRI